MTRAAFPSIEFAVTPRFDAFYALYALSSNSASTLDTWKEDAQTRLPQDFERVARRVAPLPIFWPLLADAIQNTPGEITFADMLATLAELPLEDLKRNVLSGIFHDRAAVDSLLSGKKGFKQVVTDDALGAELLGAFGLRPFDQNSPSAKAIASLLTRADTFRDELVFVLRRFWESVFRRDWTLLEPRLRAESFRLSDLREEATTSELVRELNLPVSFDDKANQIRPKAGAAIGYDRIDRCYVVPSAFNTRRWWARYETQPGHITLYFPILRDPNAVNAIVEDAGAGGEALNTAEINAESVFRALGDTTRYAIASILARTPTTSAELARSLNVSKPTITHHVQALRSAGLLSETPSAGSTRLSLREDTLAALSRAAIDQLFSSKGDLTLATTRKRRAG